MLQAKVIEGREDEIVVLTQEELDRRIDIARRETDKMLLGARWGVSDCIERLNGYRRSDFVNKVLIPNKDELIQIGASLHWPEGSGDRYRFRATKMAQWMEDHLDQIDAKGWD